MPKRIVTNAVFVAVDPDAPDEPAGPELSPEDAQAINDALEEAFAAGVTAPQIVEAISALHVAPEDELEPMPDEEQLPEQMRITLRAERVRLQRSRRDVELGDRRRLLGQLVTEAGRAPATVWADSKATRGKPYLERMTLAELRAHVACEIASVPAGARRSPRTPVPGERPDLTEQQAAIAREMGVDPAEYARVRDQFSPTGAQR